MPMNAHSVTIIVDWTWLSMLPSGLMLCAGIVSVPNISVVKNAQRNAKSMIRMNSAIGTSLQMVPTTLMKAACFMPASTMKFMPQITIEPPMIE